MLRSAARRLRSLLAMTDSPDQERELVPPSDLLLFIGGGGFVLIGNEFFNYFVALGGLQPNERVLDVCFGVGPMAGPLTRYLAPACAYAGFDICKGGIGCCQ